MMTYKCNSAMDHPTYFCALNTLVFLIMNTSQKSYGQRILKFTFSGVILAHAKSLAKTAEKTSCSLIKLRLVCQLVTQVCYQEQESMAFLCSATAKGGPGLKYISLHNTFFWNEK